ncbi:LytTR family DNA-binding domain-containing protein [Chitinophaga sp. sic0106]|uniref:LytR/AlgR family response regulator transcription factor n=1 Tax=Chitinophaga sp. sic0106 TaxID=2854785 RepID=UPI001C45E969|nr:LytTR family DNA-binding domain-containing protein [Chitinophaga sp. sic0106]MBV7529436.1 LytTR family DNA-binding domain-containing protein [Chitinophaga sp. sic0106]
MINCLIVDDEQHAIDILVHYVKQTTFLNLVHTTTDPLEALKILSTQKVDLIFLDIQMPEISGIDFIKTIQGKSRVILTTAYSEFAADSFDLEVIDYLLKPIPFPRFLKAAQRALSILSANAASQASDDSQYEDYIFVKTELKGKMLKVNLPDIDYIEGMKNYVAIHHNGAKTMALLNLKDLEDRLPRKYFMRIHKSFIVAVPKISGIEGNQIQLKNIKADILLGETYKPAFLEMMKEKMMQ